MLKQARGFQVGLDFFSFVLIQRQRGTLEKTKKLAGVLRSSVENSEFQRIISHYVNTVAHLGQTASRGQMGRHPLGARPFQREHSDHGKGQHIHIHKTQFTIVS